MDQVDGCVQALCPEDPMKLERMRQRVMDDAIMEAWALKALQ